MQSTHFQTYPRIAPANVSAEMQGKTVLITGGNGGIGAATAKSFAEARAKTIILVGRNRSKLDATAESLKVYKATTSIETRVVDIASQESVKALFDSLKYSPDVLVNNAGYLTSPEPFMDVDLEEYWKGFQINVLGTIFVTQAYLRHRKAHTSASTPVAVVININTIAAHTSRFSNLSSYGASKAAQARWTELLQDEFPTSVARFISVHPGAVQTEMFVKSGFGDPEKLELLATEDEAGFQMTDISLTANFLVWLASDEAAFLAGRFVYANWDVDAMVKAKDQIVGKDLFVSNLSAKA